MMFIFIIWWSACQIHRSHIVHHWVSRIFYKTMIRASYSVDGKKKIHENRHNLWTNNNRRHFRKVKGSQQQQFGRIKRTPSCPLLTEIRIKNASLETPCAYLFNTLCLSNSSPCSCWLLACLTSFYLARATANKTIYIQLTCDKLEHIARQLPIVTTASLASVIFSRSLNTNCKCEEANPNRSNRAHTKKRDIRSTKTMTRKKLNRKKKRNTSNHCQHSRAIPTVHRSFPFACFIGQRTIR